MHILPPIPAALLHTWAVGIAYARVAPITGITPPQCSAGYILRSGILDKWILAGEPTGRGYKTWVLTVRQLRSAIAARAGVFPGRVWV